MEHRLMLSTSLNMRARNGKLWIICVYVFDIDEVGMRGKCDWRSS